MGIVEQKFSLVERILLPQLKLLRKVGIGYRKSLLLVEKKGTRSILFEYAGGNFSLEHITLEEARAMIQILMSPDIGAGSDAHPVYKIYGTSGTQVPISDRWFAIVDTVKDQYSLVAKSRGRAIYRLTQEERQTMSNAINSLLGEV